MKKALLYQKLPHHSTRCGICQRRCVITEDEIGYCKTRVNKGGKLYSTIYGVVSSINNDPIEKKPVFHFQPGSFCLSLGTFGCNFKCSFCQNWKIAWADYTPPRCLPAEGGAPPPRRWKEGQKISPEQAVALARKYNSAGIAITYNEPAIWLEYSLDIFKTLHPRRGGAPPSAGRHAGGEIYTVWVTNGYATPEAIDIIAPYLDVYRVDLKSFDDKFYQKLINVPKALPIFETTKYLHDKYPKIHLECVTNIIPDWNDSDDTLIAIAKWIKENLGDATPWHVTRFFPYAKLTDVPPTPPETLYKAREIGLKEGLKFVYIGNLEVDAEDDTFCPKCGSLAIRRTGYLTKILAVTSKGKCPKCGENLNLKV